MGTEGLDHEKIYKVRVKVGNKTAIGSAVGKKRATVDAAKNLLENHKIDYQISAIIGNKVNTQNVLTKPSLSFARKKLMAKAKSALKIRNDMVTDLQMDEIFTHNSFLQEHGNKNVKYKIFSVTGTLASLSGNPVKLNVNYCASCKIFFIGYAEFKYYRDIYGILLGNYFIQENFDSASGNYKNLSTESVLRLSGYTVNQRDNLSAEQRHLILSNLMDREIITKPRIMNYLQFFINVSKYRDNMRIANQKWQEDLIWVRKYNINTQRHFLINSIQKF